MRAGIPVDVKSSASSVTLLRPPESITRQLAGKMYWALVSVRRSRLSIVVSGRVGGPRPRPRGREGRHYGTRRKMTLSRNSPDVRREPRRKPEQSRAPHEGSALASRLFNSLALYDPAASVWNPTAFSALPGRLGGAPLRLLQRPVTSGGWTSGSFRLGPAGGCVIATTRLPDKRGHCRRVPIGEGLGTGGELRFGRGRAIRPRISVVQFETGVGIFPRVWRERGKETGGRSLSASSWCSRASSNSRAARRAGTDARELHDELVSLRQRYRGFWLAPGHHRAARGRAADLRSGRRFRLGPKAACRWTP